MSTFSEYRFWSPMLGAQAVRLSMVDARGDEFYRIIVRDASAKVYRAARDAALDAIEDAIAAGLQPGEVKADESVE